jgi:hypothetical protein
VYIVWVISPPSLPPSPSPSHFQEEPVLPKSLILLRRRQKHKKEDKASLSKYKEIEIIPCILSDHNALKLELNNKNNNKNMQTIGS